MCEHEVGKPREGVEEETREADEEGDGTVEVNVYGVISGMSKAYLFAIRAIKLTSEPRRGLSEHEGSEGSVSD